MKEIAKFLLFSMIFTSCGVIENESSVDERFVGLWKFNSSNSENLKPSQEIIDNPAALSALTKIPGSHESYAFKFFGLDAPIIVSKKDAYNLSGKQDNVEFALSLNKDTKRLVFRIDNKDKNVNAQIEFEKIK